MEMGRKLRRMVVMPVAGMTMKCDTKGPIELFYGTSDNDLALISRNDF